MVHSHDRLSCQVNPVDSRDRLSRQVNPVHSRDVNPVKQ